MRIPTVVAIAFSLTCSSLAAQTVQRGKFVDGLVPSTGGDPGTVLHTQKVCSNQGGFIGVLPSFLHFGCDVSSIGDLDGDGVPDLAVGAKGEGDGGVNTGAVWILFLDEDLTVRNQQKISSTFGGFSGPLHSGDEFGYAVGSLGDLDGDGVLDLAVGADLDDDGGDGTGALWVLFLNVDGTVKASQKISALVGGFTGVLAGDVEFGSALACLGDVDGDGVQDLAAGARSTSDGNAGAGATWVLFLNTDGTVKGQQKISMTAGNFLGYLTNSAGFGRSCTAPGDLDGDGTPDLIVCGNGVWVLFLQSDGQVRTHQRIVPGSAGFTGNVGADDEWGEAAAAIGDVDGDGVVDLAVATPGDDDGSPNSGAVWILFLTPSGTVHGFQKISSTQGGFTGQIDNDDGFARSLSALGDVNRDGIPDLVVGAENDDDPRADRGAVYLLALDGIVRLGFERADDFQTSLPNGLDLSATPAFERFFTLFSSGSNAGAAIFDSTPGGPNDPGLAPDLLVGLGNLLVLQESAAPAQTIPGLFDQPAADTDGGALTFSFHAPAELLRLRLVDIDRGVRETSSIRLLDGNGRARTYTIHPRWTRDLVLDGAPGWGEVDLTTTALQFGFHSAVSASEDPGFEPRGVVQMDVSLGATAAIDGLVFSR